MTGIWESEVFLLIIIIVGLFILNCYDFYSLDKRIKVLESDEYSKGM